MDSIPKAPEEEHSLFAQEEDIMPNLAENIEQHLTVHSGLINSDKFELLSKKGQLLLMKHYSETMRMKEALEKQALINKLEQVNSMLSMSQMGIPPEQIMGLQNGQGQAGPKQKVP